jgi:hypothetical protein
VRRISSDGKTSDEKRLHTFRPICCPPSKRPSRGCRLRAHAREVDEWLNEDPPLVSPERLDAAWPKGRAVGEAERKAARSLGVSVEVVLETSIDLWGCTLTEKRDELILYEVDRAWRIRNTWEEPSPQRRGHVTRELVAEIRQALKGTE